MENIQPVDPASVIQNISIAVIEPWQLDWFESHKITQDLIRLDKMR